MWADVCTTVVSRNSVQVRTAAFTLSSWASVEPTFTPTRSCCWARLTDFSGWATGPAGDNNTSSSLPSCALLLCSYHLRQLAGVKASCYPHNWRPKDPETYNRHTHMWLLQLCLPCVGGVWRAEEAIYCAFGHTQARWDQMAKSSWKEMHRCERFNKKHWEYLVT